MKKQVKRKPPQGKIPTAAAFQYVRHFCFDLFNCERKEEN